MGDNRNYQKFRLLGGFHLNQSFLTYEERVAYNAIRTLVGAILSQWDESTEVFTGKTLPPYKCSYCGRRGNVPHEYQSKNFCLKHFKLMQE